MQGWRRDSKAIVMSHLNAFSIELGNSEAEAVPGEHGNLCTKSRALRYSSHQLCLLKQFESSLNVHGPGR